MVQHHFLLLTYSAPSHLNPALHLALRLIRMGALVTITTTVEMLRRVHNTSVTAIPGLSLVDIDNYHDEDDEAGKDDSNSSLDHPLSDFWRRGSRSVANLIASAKINGGHPFTCLIHTLLFPWAIDLARRNRLPSALLWIQPATLLGIFHYYFKDDSFIKNKLSSASSNLIIELPGLPPLQPRDLPPPITSPISDDAFVLPLMGDDFRILLQEPNPIVLVNTVDELEADALKSVRDSFKTIAIGPLLPSILLEGENYPSETGNEYMEWLSSKPESSVIYISFGSLSVLSKKQMEEMARGLIESRRPFLWSIREEKEQEKVREYMEKMEEKGKIVSWCKQVDVLSHKSVGCFVSHCGWNSTLESLVVGIPVVAVPQGIDQTTNAKLVEDVWKIGVRVMVEEDGAGGEGVVREEEIRRCVEEVMGDGEKATEVRKNAAKWKEICREAVKMGGSSDANLRAFMAQQGGAPQQ